MKILVVCQHYWPEPFPSTDICESLALLGHTVHVLTDVPNYPMGYIYPEYRRKQNREEIHNGVRIFRAFTIGRRNNSVFRILNYYSYAISSTLFLRKMDTDYDVVLTIQASPIMMVNAAVTYAKRHAKNCLFYTMDLWPASLAAGGISEDSAIYKLFAKVSGKLYRRADKILITSQMFREYLKQNFSITDDKIGYLPQFAAAQFDALPEQPPKETVDLMFAGNIGAAQSLSTVLDAAKILEAYTELRWHIVGDGSELENLKTQAKELGLKNVVFHGRKPAEQMPQYYAMADAMLVTLTADPFIGMTLPAKVQSYMAAGKPVLAAANGEIPNVIAAARCGFCAPAEDAAGFADAVKAFLACEDKEALERNAKAYYQANFAKEMFMAKLENALQAACSFIN